MNNSNNNRSVQRCLSLLKAFRHGSGKTLTELSRSVDLPHSTVLRFLHTLAEEGYVKKDDTRWRLTPQMLELGFAAIESMGVTDAVQEALQTLANFCSGTANLGAAAGDHVTILSRAVAAEERRKLIIMNLRVGSTLPSDSALYTALTVGRDQWTTAQYPAGNHISVAVPITTHSENTMTLGVSMSLADFPQARIEHDIIPMLRKSRDTIEPLLRLGA